MKKVRAALGIAAGIFGVAGIAYLLSQPKENSIEQKLAPAFISGIDATLKHESDFKKSLDYGPSLSTSEKTIQNTAPSYEPDGTLSIAENMIRILTKDESYSVRVAILEDYLMNFDINRIEIAVSEITDNRSGDITIDELKEAIPNVLNRKADAGETFVEHTRNLLRLNHYFKSIGDSVDFVKKIAPSLAEHYEQQDDGKIATHLLLSIALREYGQACTVSKPDQKCTLKLEERIPLVESIKRAIFQNNRDTIGSYALFLQATEREDIREKYPSERRILEERVAEYLRKDIYAAIGEGRGDVLSAARLLTTEKISATNRGSDLYLWSDAGLRSGFVSFNNIPMSPTSADFNKARELLSDVSRVPHPHNMEYSVYYINYIIGIYKKLGMNYELKLYSDRLGRELPAEISKPLQERISSALAH